MGGEFSVNLGDGMYPRIRNLREDKDLTQQQMANYLRCSQRIYSNYERGDICVWTQVMTHVFSADFPPFIAFKIFACLWTRGKFQILD